MSLSCSEIAAQPFHLSQVIANSRALGARLMKYGYKLVTDGTDNHLVLWDMRKEVRLCAQDCCSVVRTAHDGCTCCTQLATCCVMLFMLLLPDCNMLQGTNRSITPKCLKAHRIADVQ